MTIEEAAKKYVTESGIVKPEYNLESGHYEININTFHRVERAFLAGAKHARKELEAEIKKLMEEVNKLKYDIELINSEYSGST